MTLLHLLWKRVHLSTAAPALNLSSLSLLLTLLVPDGLVAQPARPAIYQPAPERELQALGDLRQAVAALGGSANIDAMPGVTADGTATSGQTTEHLHWEAKGKAFRMEQGGRTVAANEKAGWRSQDDKAIQLPRHVWASTFIPISLGQDLDTALRNLLVTVQESVEKSDDKLVSVRVRDEQTSFTHAFTERYWYLDRTTHLPVKVEFQERSVTSANFYIWTTVSFATFTNTAGCLFPTHLTFEPAGLPTTVVDLTSIKAQPDLDASRFELPEGAGR